jgi:transposase
MPKTYTVTSEMSLAIREKMKSVKDSYSYRKMESVALIGEGKSNSEASKITGYCSDYISVLVSQYIRLGIESISGDNRNGGNNQTLTKSQEEEFLSRFKEKAEKGQIITVGDIAKAYDDTISNLTTRQNPISTSDAHNVI